MYLYFNKPIIHDNEHYNAITRMEYFLLVEAYFLKIWYMNKPSDFSEKYRTTIEKLISSESEALMNIKNSDNLIKLIAQEYLFNNNKVNIY
jgi:hypothetical protein